jgi:hypothetical protein
VYPEYAYDIENVLLFPIQHKASWNVKENLLRVSTPLLVAFLIFHRSTDEEILEMWVLACTNFCKGSHTYSKILEFVQQWCELFDGAA